MNFEVKETVIIVTLTNLSTYWCLQADEMSSWLFAYYFFIYTIVAS